MVPEHLGEAPSRLRCALHCEETQSQPIKAIGDLRQRELMFLDVHQEVATPVEREEVPGSNYFFRWMSIRESENRASAATNPVGCAGQSKGRRKFPGGLNFLTSLGAVQRNAHQPVGLQQVN